MDCIWKESQDHTCMQLDTYKPDDSSKNENFYQGPLEENEQFSQDLKLCIGEYSRACHSLVQWSEHLYSIFDSIIERSPFFKTFYEIPHLVVQELAIELHQALETSIQALQREQPRQNGDNSTYSQ